MSDKEWLDALKVGDEVCVSGDYGSIGRIASITHTTPNFVHVGTDKFRRRDGRALSTDTWSRRSIQPVTDAVRERIDFQSAVNFLQRITWDRVPRDVVFEVRRLYQESLTKAKQEIAERVK